LRLSSIRCVPDEWIKSELSHNESELSRLFAKDSWCFHAEIVAMRRVAGLPVPFIQYAFFDATV
jgi:hypothetical protein